MDGQITRRTLLGATAVGGAALLGTSASASAGTADPADDGFFSGEPTVAAASAGVHALGLPVTDGSQAVTLGFLDFAPVADTGIGSAATAYSPNPDRLRSQPAGFLNAPCPLPAGASVTKVDVVGYTDVDSSQTWRIALFDLTSLDPVPSLGSVVPSGLGQLIDVIQLPAPVAVGAGQWLVVQGETTASSWVVGAVVHYVPKPVPAPPAPVVPVLVPITPQRVFDSRLGGGKLQPDEERTVSVANALSGLADVVPASATAVAITVTITETEGDFGFVSGFPFGAVWSGTSMINWFGSGQSLATAAILALGGDRRLVLRGGVAATHVIVDVTAYVG